MRGCATQPKPPEHDFFAEQPVKSPDAYFLQNIIHDWSDKYGLQILRKLREAAGPDTNLFSVDKVIPYTAPLKEQERIEMPGVLYADLPEPLSVVGGGDAFAYFLSMHVSIFACSLTRRSTDLQYSSKIFATAWNVHLSTPSTYIARRVGGWSRCSSSSRWVGCRLGFMLFRFKQLALKDLRIA